MNGLILAFIAYFIVLLSIGIAFYQSNKEEKSFALGNRSLNYWVTAISAQTSDMGSWLFMGYPALIFTNGLFEAWTAIGLVAIMALNWYFIAPKIRTETYKYNSLTLSSYFASRLTPSPVILSEQDESKDESIKIISALISLLFFMFYISSGFIGLGRLFESAFSIDYFYALLIGLFITASYTYIGGFLAVSWCNLFQGILLLFIILFVPFYALHIIGGFQAITSAALASDISLHLFPSIQKIGNALLLICGFGLGYFGQPHILINFMGIKDVNKMKYAARVGITWQILALFGGIMVGLTSIGFFAGNVVNPEHLFVIMVTHLFSPFVAGFALCGILAAILSTVTTQILVATSNITEDLYKTVYKNSTNKQLLWVSRLGVLGITFIAFLIAMFNTDSIYNLVLYAWSGLGSAFGPLLILCLYSKIPDKRGGIAGILTGAIASGIWPFFNGTISPLIPGFGLSTAAIILFSKRM